jgi:hypothetical protein
MAVAMGLDGVDQRLPRRVRRSFGALAPHTDESAVVGEADVANDGARKPALGAFRFFRFVITSG